MPHTNNIHRTLQNRALLGIAFMLVGLVLYTISDVLIKYLMGMYPVHQTTCLRALTRLGPLLLAVWCVGGPKVVFSTQHPRRHLVRLGVNLAYTYAFMYAFSVSSLTVIYTLSYTAPLFMLLLSAWMFREKIPARRWGAIGVGWVGVWIATQGGSHLFEWTVPLVLLASFLGALNKILMRRLAATEHSLAIAIYPNIAMILVTFPWLISSWTPMSVADWAVFAGMGVITAAGQYAIAEALRFTQVPTLASIDYSTVIWVVAFDFLWWNITPSGYTMMGAFIIIGSNLYILYSAKPSSE